MVLPKQLFSLLLSLVLLSTAAISDTPSEEWNKTFETTYGSVVRSIRQTSDGGYILTGIAFMNWNGNGDTAAWLIKTDMNGNMQWNKMFLQEMPNAYSAQQTSDGGYIVAGMTYSNNGALIKTDADGNLQWNKTFGKNGIDSVRQTSDDGYIFFGGVTGSSGGVTEYALIKTNKNGELQWNGTFGIISAGGCDDHVRQTSDGGYIAVGDDRYWDALLVKIDANGNLQWNKTFGGKDEDRAYSIRQTLDGGFIIGGSTESYNPYGESDAWLIKTDNEGNLQWNKTFGYGSISSVQQTSDGGYIFATGVQLIKTYTNGSLQWDKKISGCPVLQSLDGGYIIARNQDWGRYGRGSFHAQLIKLSNESLSPTPIPTATPAPTFIVTQTVTTTSTSTATQTPSPTTTPMLTPTSTHTLTPTPTATPTLTPTPTPISIHCDGCLYADSCIPFGTRLGPQYSVVPFNNGTASYCDVAKKAIEPQKNDTAACQNNYECISNYCTSGVCGNLQKELSATRGLLEQILGFLRAIFGKFFPFPSTVAK